MLLLDWLYEVMPYLCAIAGLATASWDFRHGTDKKTKGSATSE
jgi:hypothetical protein